MSDQTPRHVGIREFVVRDINDLTEPPELPLLRVSLIGRDLVSLAIEQYDEDHKTATYERVTSIIVDLEPLCNGLRASIDSHGTKVD